MPPSTPSRGGHIWITAGARKTVRRRVGARYRHGHPEPRLLPRVFDMFMQGDTTKSRGGGGLGIGLTLARTLVEMHGGSVDARSEGLGKGQRVRGAPAAGGGFATLRRPNLQAPRPAAVHGPHACPGGRRQPRRRRQPPRAVGVAWRGSPGRLRRPCCAGRVSRLSTRGRAARYRHAGHGRLRGCTSHPPASRVEGHDAHRADWLGPGEGPPELRGGRASITISSSPSISTRCKVS